jgi:hypothetical protein
MTIVTPDKVQYGDQVFVDGQSLVVKAIEGPDYNGTFDFYLTDGSKDVHKVVSDPIAIIA